MESALERNEIIRHNLEIIQKRNIELVSRLDGLTYGENSEDSGYYLIDLNIVGTAEGRAFIRAKAEQLLLKSNPTLRSLETEGNYPNIQASPVELVAAENYPNSFVTFPKRVNLRTFPIPTQITGTANLFEFKVDGVESQDLTQSGSAFPNTRALVLATTDVSFGELKQNKEKWLYVRIHNLEGWVPAKEVCQITDGSIITDPIRPLDNFEKLADNLGVITAYGLRIEGDELVPVIPVFANGDLDQENLPQRGDESLGDGTMRNGENSVLTLGDTVQIIEKVGDKLVILLNGEKYLISPEFINRGYLDVNGESIAKVLNTLVHPNPSDLTSFAPYGWGGEDGVNFDCSLMVDVLTRTFGITVARGADPQRFGVNGSEFKIIDSFKHQVSVGETSVEYTSTLPLKAEDLPSEVQACYDSKNRIFTKIITVSCGPHIMVLHSIDKDGNIIYVHSVGFINKINAKKGEYIPADQIWSIVKGPAVNTGFNETNGDLELKEGESIRSWGDSYPPYVGWSEDMRKAWPASYLVIH